MGIVVLTAFLLVGSGEAKAVVTGKTPTLHPVLAGFIVGLFLQIFFSVNAPLATKFCYLIIAGALLYNGAAIFTALNQVNKPAPKPKTTGSGVLKPGTIPGVTVPLP